MEYRNVGVLEYWSIGVLECWNVEVLECWSVGVLECWGFEIWIISQIVRKHKKASILVEDT